MNIISLNTNIYLDTSLLCLQIMNMPVKYVNAGAITILLIFSLSCSSSKHSRKSQNTMPGTWQEGVITIDGDSKDWPSPYPNFDAKAKVAYATSNDKQYLYVTMETGDEMTQMKILKQGMTVSIDTSGGKDASFHINYPLPNDNDEVDIPKAGGGRKQQDGETIFSGKQINVKLSKMIKSATQFSLEGFNTGNGGYMASQTAPCGIKVSASIDEYKELVWEAIIPFSAIYNKSTISAADAGKPISVCFAIKGFKHPSSKDGENGSANMNSNPSNMSGRGGGGGGRGGKGSKGGGGVAENPLQHLYESTKTWKYFGIAYKQG